MNNIDKLISYILDHYDEIDDRLRCGCTVFFAVDESGDIYDSSNDWL